jgi:hypothetical protein
MCGKTLRVPDLDGSVRPLPTPELNLEDSSLVDALGELAGIGHQTEAGVPVRPAAGKIVIAPQHSAPEPIAVEPLAPAQPVHVADTERALQPARSQQDTAASAADAEGTVNDPHEELRTIVASPSADKPTSRRTPKKRPSRRRRANRRTWIERTLIAGGFLTVGFGLALLFSPSSAFRADDAGRDGLGEQDQDDAPAKGAPVEELVPAVQGRVTYVTEAGDSRPDQGAKIIVLPVDRKGTVKLDVVGFLVGSADADESIAAASLRALGGNVASADLEGQYRLELGQPGTYHLLVISRHQSRNWEVGVEEDVQQQLARFFVRPSTLLGQLAYDVQEFQYRGKGTSSRDFAFARE